MQGDDRLLTAPRYIESYSVGVGRVNLAEDWLGCCHREGVGEMVFSDGLKELELKTTPGLNGGARERVERA